MDQGTGKLDTSYVELLSCGQTGKLSTSYVELLSWTKEQVNYALGM